MQHPYTFTIPEQELYDEDANRFIYIKEQQITIAHSLLSISKWESKWHRPFISMEPLTKEQEIDYIRCMTLTQNVKSEIYYAIPDRVKNEIYAYMDDPMTGTTITEDPRKAKPKTPMKNISSEELYYDMVALNIPFDPCEKWHLNRLIMLIRVCNEKNNPDKRKMTAKERSALNKARRAKHHTKG